MHARPQRFSFLIKIGVAALLAAAFDWLFPDGPSGACIGAFALLWLAALILVKPTVRRAGIAGAIVGGLAALFVVALVYDPGPLAWFLFWCALSVTALLPRTIRFDDAWHWAVRLLLHGLSGPFTPLIDLLRLLQVRPGQSRPTLRSLAALLALPLIGVTLFTLLFANANPLIGDLFSRLRLPPPGEVIKWLVATLLVWPALRPHRLVTRLAARVPEPAVDLPGVSLPSVLLALTLFNVLFAVENGLDIAFLWSGARLPEGVSAAEYAHRGAYPLIATALLAGIFVLTVLRPGSAAASHLWARRLVAVWVAQNVFLLASSALRTIDYIELYDLTAWRLAALLWMLLVAIGLILICWRMWLGLSARWLINANAIAAGIVLVPCCFIDLQAIAASWNVRHAREVGGTGAPIDLCNLHWMGPPALLPLIELEHRPLPPGLLDRVQFVRSKVLGGLAAQQSKWSSWTPHGAWRLSRAQALLGPNPLQVAGPRNCDGSPLRQPPALTGGPAQ